MFFKISIQMKDVLAIKNENKKQSTAIMES